MKPRMPQASETHGARRASARTRWAPTLVVSALLLAFAMPAARGEDGGETDAEARARRKAVAGLGKSLARIAKSPRWDRKRDEIKTILDGLDGFSGKETGEAALRGLLIPDEEIRDRLFAIIDREHHPDYVEPLSEMLTEDKRFRRDPDIKKRIARSLSVIGKVEAIEPLTELLRSDEDAEVVSAVCDALATFGGAPIDDRREAVKRMVDLYETTWNYAHSFNPDHRLEKQRFLKRWREYGKPMLAALKSLTGQHNLTRPAEWRRWWNDNKRARQWVEPVPGAGS